MNTITCDHESSSKYLQTLFNIKRSMHNLSPTAQDEQWLAHYKKILSDDFTSMNMANILALIHPDFYTKNGESIAELLNWKNNNKFASGILKTDQCQAKEYTGIPCIFNEIPDIRGKCQADHKWPNSLGGPSILDNRLILCKFHNGMKSNDISHFNWRTAPNWLKEYHCKLYRLKS